jgi:hypothetical protein
MPLPRTYALGDLDGVLANNDQVRRQGGATSSCRPTHRGGTRGVNFGMLVMPVLAPQLRYIRRRKEITFKDEDHHHWHRLRRPRHGRLPCRNG